jgi:23S rRNA (pseudouridine1915-N3)-methyltransferase
VGRPRAPGLAAAIGEYEQRAAHYWPFEAIEVREEPARSGAPDLVREKEGERLLKAVTAGAHLVACDPTGRSKDSASFATWLQLERERAQDVAFVIGGALGLSDAVRAAARTTLSLAPWTLPHELARLVLVEQIYRAGTIVRGEPYHK